MCSIYGDDALEKWTSSKTDVLRLSRLPSPTVESFLEDEEAVLQHFTYQIFLICGEIDHEQLKLHHRRKWRVASTAAYYFRRFFATESILFHDPRLIMLAAIFLAAKVEEHYKEFVSISELKRIYKNCEDSDIHSAEKKIVEALQFQLNTSHPQNCMNTILNKIRIEEPQITSAMGNGWMNKCTQEIVLILTTQAALRVPPVFIAYWSLYQTASSKIETDSLEKCFQSMLQQFGIENNGNHRDHTYYQNIVKEYSEQSSLGENFERMHNFLTALKPLAKWESSQSVNS